MVQAFCETLKNSLTKYMYYLMKLVNSTKFYLTIIVEVKKVNWLSTKILYQFNKTTVSGRD